MVNIKTIYNYCKIILVVEEVKKYQAPGNTVLNKCEISMLSNLTYIKLIVAN